LFPLFATSVNDTGGECRCHWDRWQFATGGECRCHWDRWQFATGVVDTVSTTQAELVAKFAAGVVDTGSNFTTGVIDTGANLTPVSLRPVVNLDLRGDS
jgi:hypothetical protein